MFVDRDEDELFSLEMESLERKQNSTAGHIGYSGFRGSLSEVIILIRDLLISNDRNRTWA
jgi:hypothetical protein